MTESTVGTGDDITGDTTAEQAPVDQKAAFKAALERKNAAAHARNQVSLDGDNNVHGDSHAAGAKRQFRRKSGGGG